MSADRMRDFRMDDQMRLEAGLALQAAYEGTDYPRPPLDEVIDQALATVACDIVYERVPDQAACNKVDDCTATAVVLRHLAKWLSPDIAVEVS